MAGRPAPRPLEIEVLNKFKRHDVSAADALRTMYPQYIKDPPAVGDPGNGSVIWVGLNPDPCKAKYLEKCGLTQGPKKARPVSAPCGGEQGKPGVCGKLTRPSSVPPGGRSAGEPRGDEMVAGQMVRTRASSSPAGRRNAKEHRNLAATSSQVHFLEQRLKLPGILPAETFTSLGAWPVRGAAKPDNIDELLYNGVSQSQEGRHAYLKARSLIDPQKKFRTPATTNQEIAWQVHLGKPSRLLRPVPNSAAACVVPS